MTDAHAPRPLLDRAVLDDVRRGLDAVFAALGAGLTVLDVLAEPRAEQEDSDTGGVVTDADYDGPDGAYHAFLRHLAAEFGFLVSDDPELIALALAAGFDDPLHLNLDADSHLLRDVIDRHGRRLVRDGVDALIRARGMLLVPGYPRAHADWDEVSSTLFDILEGAVARLHTSQRGLSEKLIEVYGYDAAWDAEIEHIAREIATRRIR